MFKQLRARLKSNREVYLEIDEGNNNHFRWSAYDVEHHTLELRSPGWGFDTPEDAVEHAKEYMDVEGE